MREVGCRPASRAPVPSVDDFTVEFEYARESNGDALDSYGWYAQAAYQLSDVAWTPTLTYRYAFFQGDDLDTPENEAFDPLSSPRMGIPARRSSRRSTGRRTSPTG